MIEARKVTNALWPSISLLYSVRINKKQSIRVIKRLTARTWADNIWI